MIFVYLAINQVTLLGRVGGDPQKRGSEEHPVVVFSLATHQSFLNNNDGIYINYQYNLKLLILIIVIV